MSDVADFTRVSAGTTTLVKSGVLACNNPNVATPLPFGPVPATTRSLLVLLQNLTGTSGAVSIEGLSVVGGGTNILWQDFSSVASSENGNVFFTGDGAVPVYLPFYGVVDTTGTLNLTVNLVSTWNYWILALPDADLSGTPYAPLSVTQQINPGAGTPNQFTVNTGLNGALSVRTAEDGHGVSLTLNNNGGELIASPGQGFRPVIDFLTFTGGFPTGTLELKTGGAGGTLIAAHVLPPGANYPAPWPGPIVGATNADIWAIWTGAGAIDIVANYHTEPTN